MKDGKRQILVADDDPQIRQVLELLLTGEGYHVLTACDGEEAVAYLSPDTDLYILDVNMPRMSGLLAASRIRKEADTPIIFLTAYSAESDKIMGFSVGADDYIVKPFSNAELLMRVRAILRRSTRQQAAPETGKNRIPFGDLVLDRDAQAVIREGVPVSLTYTEFQILELLVTNKKKIFSLDHIYSCVWGDEAVGDGAIMVHIKNIRKKLGDNSREPVYIKTAWGRGYYVDG